MSKLLSTIALAFMMIFVPIASAQASTLPLCQNEDGSIGTTLDGQTIFEDCHWDAAHQGNGQGQSFDVVSGQYIYSDTTQGLEALAWDLFDATQASDLLPIDGATVTFTASADASSPIAPTQDTIVCTDMLGNTYQFTIS